MCVHGYMWIIMYMHVCGGWVICNCYHPEQTIKCYITKQSETREREREREREGEVQRVRRRGGVGVEWWEIWAEVVGRGERNREC